MNKHNQKIPLFSSTTLVFLFKQNSYLTKSIIDFKSWKLKKGPEEWPQGAHLHAFNPYRGKLLVISGIADDKDEDESLNIHVFSLPGSLFPQQSFENKSSAHSDVDLKR